MPMTNVDYLYCMYIVTTVRQRSVCLMSAYLQNPTPPQGFAKYYPNTYLSMFKDGWRRI